MGLIKDHRGTFSSFLFKYLPCIFVFSNTAVETNLVAKNVMLLYRDCDNCLNP